MSSSISNISIISKQESCQFRNRNSNKLIRPIVEFLYKEKIGYLTMSPFYYVVEYDSNYAIVGDKISRVETTFTVDHLEFINEFQDKFGIKIPIKEGCCGS